MTVNRGDVVLVDYPFTTGGAKVRPASSFKMTGTTFG
jgi:hypothetical protein